MAKIIETKDIDVVILCGGKGERLSSVISDRPKPLADVGDKPFLDLLIDHALSYGFLRFILCTGYKGEQIKEYYFGKSVVISQEENPLGTGGAIKNASRYIESSPFMVMNGDSHCPINFRDFVDDYFRKKAHYEIVLTQPNDRKDVGLVTVNPRLEVTSFTGTLHNAGIYLFKNDVLNIIPNKRCSLEYDILPTLIGKKFYGYLTEAPCFDIGTPQRYHSFLQNRARIG